MRRETLPLKLRLISTKRKNFFPVFSTSFFLQRDYLEERRKFLRISQDVRNFVVLHRRSYETFAKLTTILCCLFQITSLSLFLSLPLCFRLAHWFLVIGKESFSEVFVNSWNSNIRLKPRQKERLQVIFFVFFLSLKTVRHHLLEACVTSATGIDKI